MYNKNEKILRDLILLLFNDQNIHITSKVTEWNKTLRAIERHGLLSLFYKHSDNYRHLIIPSDMRNELQTKFYSNIKHNLLLFKEYLNIIKIFKQHNIRVMPIKGMDYFTRFYPAFDLRSCGDIDLIINKKDIHISIDAIKGLGYKLILNGLDVDYHIENHYHLSFIKDTYGMPAILAEIHWDFNKNTAANPLITDIWQRAEKHMIDSTTIETLSPEDSIISLAIHDRKFGDVLSLKRAVDITDLESKYNIDWDYIINQSKKYNFKAALYFMYLKINIISGTGLHDRFCGSGLPGIHKTVLKFLVCKKLFSIRSDSSLYNTYILFHFFIYDSFREALNRIIFNPYETLCMFFNLDPEISINKFFYKLWPISFFYFYFAGRRKRNLK